MKNIDDEYIVELRASEIAEDIAILNFRSFDGNNETELDEAFTLLIEEPNHNNNGTLAGKSQKDLANTLRSGGLIFEGYKGISIKPNNPRKDKDGKVIKYESSRGTGNQQLFIPKVSVRVGLKIASKLGEEIYKEYRQRIHLLAPNAEDPDFWDWYLQHNGFIIITEGAKKACSLISAGYPAIGLNGIWGWGTNLKDMFGEIEKDSCGKNLKNLHPDLEPFLDGREIILAFDRDTNSDTVKKVKQAKSALAAIVQEEGIEVTEMRWRDHKGIDDFIAAKGEKELDRIYAKRLLVKPIEQKEKSKACGDLLLEISKTATYFHTANKIAYADIYINKNRHTYAVRSKAFRLWLSGEYFQHEGKGIGSQTLQDTLNTLEAIAIFQGETHEVHLRIAEHQGKIYLDLGTPDWNAIEIDATSWRLVAEPTVRFWRPESMLPLPVPEKGGSLEDLRQLINVDNASWVLISTFLLFCFVPNQTYPILVLSAVRGSGKTTAAEILKGLIDPGKAPLIKITGDSHKLAIAASRRLLMVYDNVSHISNDQSDDLCRVATGFGYSTRTLHTTDEETTFEFTRPQIITAIDALITRDDLADRVLMIQLGEITEDKRLPYGELQKKIDDSRPRILGAFLTALSQTLAQLPDTKPDKLPRMADYARFAIAAESALGLKPGEFRETFDASRESARQVVIESSPVGEAIVQLVESIPVPENGWKVTPTESRAKAWEGTASELLKELEKHTDEATYRSRFFPKAANLLKRHLNRLKPDLISLGIDIGESRVHGGIRQLVLEKVVKISSPSSPQSEKELEPINGAKNQGDDNGDDNIQGDDNGDDKKNGYRHS